MSFPNWVVGVLLACMASVISNLGLNLQKLNHLRNDRSSAQSTAPSSQHSSAPPSPFFPPYTIPRSPPSGHKSLAFFRSSPPTPLQPLSNPSPVHPSYQSLSPSPASPSPSPLPASSSTPMSSSSPLLSSSSSASHPLLSPTRLSARVSPETPPRLASRLPSVSVPPSPVSYHRQSLWRIGLSLVVLGSIADFIALIFAAQSIIAPLGSLTLVSNTVLAPLLLRETVTPLDVLATIAIVLGSSLSVACADHRDRLYSSDELFSLFLRPRFLVYALLVCAAVCALYSAIQHVQRIQAEAPAVVYRTYRRHHRFCYAALAGIVGAQSVLLAKCVGTLLVATVSGDSVLFFHWQSYAIFLLLTLAVVVQIHYLNEGLRQFTSTYIIPVYQSFWILTSTVSGLVFFTEYRGVFDEAGTGVGFPVGVLITVAGVYVLSQRGGEDDTDDDTAGSESVEEGGQAELRVRKARAEGAGRMARASTQPVAGEQMATFPSASSSSFFILGFDGRRGGRGGNGRKGDWEDELHTAPVQSSSALYHPLSASVPSTSSVPDMEEIKEVDERAEKKQTGKEHKSGSQQR